MTKKRGWTCPHCGNRAKALMEMNTPRESDPDLTLLCVARVPPEDGSFDVEDYYPDQYDADGKVPCGMQWDPNEEE